MVKVRLIEVRMAGPGGNFGDGDTVDVTPETAQILVNMGQAAFVDEQVQVEAAPVETAPVEMDPVETATVTPEETATARPQRKRRREKQEESDVATEN